MTIVKLFFIAFVFVLSVFANAAAVRIGTTWTKSGHFYLPEGVVTVQLRCVILAAQLIPDEDQSGLVSDALYPCIQTSKDGVGSLVNSPIPLNNSYENSSVVYTLEGLLYLVSVCESEGYGKKETITTAAGTFETCHIHAPQPDGSYLERWFGPVPQGNVRVEFYTADGKLDLDEETTSYEW